VPNEKGSAAVNLEIWSDVVCPWCYLGKRRLEAALAEFEHRDEVELRWRSFELDPGAPRERDVDGATHLAQKYGMSRDEAVARQRQLAELAAGDGLDMRFDLVRGGNTFDAHRLLQLAAERGVQNEVKERFMRAHHTEGESIGDTATLERLAVEAGLDRDEVRDVLAGDRYRSAVRADEQMAASLGIGGVPFFVADRTFAASGAQSPQVLGEMLRQAWEASTTAAAAGVVPTA
jgi:predicted DsbA family dithiol-disulfide isomerase